MTIRCTHPTLFLVLGCCGFICLLLYPWLSCSLSSLRFCFVWASGPCSPNMVSVVPLFLNNYTRLLKVFYLKHFYSIRGKYKKWVFSYICFAFFLIYILEVKSPPWITYGCLDDLKTRFPSLHLTIKSTEMVLKILSGELRLWGAGFGVEKRIISRPH